MRRATARDADDESARRDAECHLSRPLDGQRDTRRSGARPDAPQWPGIRPRGARRSAHAVADVRCDPARDGEDWLQGQRLDALEQPLSGAQHQRGDVERKLVDQPLRSGTAGSPARRPRSARRGPRRPPSPASSAGSMPAVTKWKVVPPSISSGSRSWWVRTNTVMVKRRLVAPPAARVRVALPRPAAAAVHPPAHDRRAVGRERLVDEIRLSAGLAALQPVRLAPGLEPEGPRVELLGTLTEWVLGGLVRTGDIAVRRNRDVRFYLAHVI